MRIIAKTTLMQLAKPYPDARKAVCEWYALAHAAQWKSSHDIRLTDPTASIVGNRRVVFDILGGRFRLIVKADYKEQKLFIRFFGTHTDYNTIPDVEHI